jgi:hypothetical protein
MRTLAQGLLGSYVVACVLIGAAAVFALLKGDWLLAIFWTVWIAFTILRYRFFPNAGGRRPMHPPNESTLQFLRKRHHGES